MEKGSVGLGMTKDRKVIIAPEDSPVTSVTPIAPEKQEGVPIAMSKQLGGKGYILASSDALFDWARTGSMLPLTFGLACCAVEMIHSYMSRYDLDRFGMIP